MKINSFEAIFPNFELISSPDTFFSTVKYDYPEYFNNGFFLRTTKSSIYLYRIHKGEQSHTGILACIDIEDYLDGKVIKHEKTLATKEQDMMKLLLQRKAMVKPVLLTYQPHKDINKVIEQLILDHKPFFEVTFEEEQEKHSFFQIAKETANQQLMKLFDDNVNQVYIADGHHRCSTSARLYKTQKGKRRANADYSQLLCAVFPFDELVIHDYNRVIEILNEITPTRLIAEISRVFEVKHIKNPKKPKRKHELMMYISHEWYRLKWRKEILEKYKDRNVLLDADLLDEEVLQKIFKMKDIISDERIKYVEGMAGVQGLIDKSLKSDYRVGFCIYPVDVSEMVKIADEGGTMPPKSTWFEPRIKNGLIVKPF